MGQIVEKVRYDEDVYLIETTDPVLGGVDGTANKQAIALANRTAFLKKQLEDLNADFLEVQKGLDALQGFDAPHIQRIEDTANNAQIKALEALSYIPPGFIMSALINEKKIEGWLLCDGTAISRTKYAALFAVIADKYGRGDGIKDFNLPDFRGVFLRGLDRSAGIDPNRELGKVQEDAIRNITGSWNGNVVSSRYKEGSGALSARNISGNVLYGYGRGIYDGVGIDFDAGRAKDVKVANENRPINQAVNYFIKY